MAKTDRHVADQSPGEWVELQEAADLCGVTPKHMRRVWLLAVRGFSPVWHGQRLVVRGDASSPEIAVDSLPLDAREAYLTRRYHLNLALPDTVAAHLAPL